MINPLAVVQTNHIGNNVTIHEFAIIREDVIIQDNVVIHPHVVIEDGITLNQGVEIFPGTVLGKIPEGAGATARPINYVKKLVIGENCAIGPNAVIYYDVEIDHNTLIGDGASIREQVRIGHHNIISRYVTVNYNTTIGNNTKIMDLTHITGNFQIGNNVFIGVLVSTSNDNFIVERDYSEDKVKGPIIEDDASIGSGAIILPGVKIGKGAFVASGAVVTSDVAPYNLVMGIPAKVTKILK